MAFIWEQFHNKCPSPKSVTCFQRLHFWNSYQCSKLSQKSCQSSCLEYQIINIKLKKISKKVPSPPPKLPASGRRTGSNLEHCSYHMSQGPMSWNITDLASNIYLHHVIDISFNTLRPRQNGRHFADDLFKCIFLMNENIWIQNKIPLIYVQSNW